MGRKDCQRLTNCVISASDVASSINFANSCVMNSVFFCSDKRHRHNQPCTVKDTVQCHPCAIGTDYPTHILQAALPHNRIHTCITTWCNTQPQHTTKWTSAGIANKHLSTQQQQGCINKNTWCPLYKQWCQPC